MKEIPVLYTDADVLVVNKPFGLPVQGGAGISVCLVDILSRQTGSPVFPVHRLDRDTSGILLVARTKESASKLTRALASKDVKKRYTAICFNTPEKGEGVITVPVGKGRDKKPAETRYRCISTANGFSMIEAELGTGRTHQIRIHLASLGCPILADDKYGDFPRNRQIRRDYGVRKLQLAATELELPSYLSLPRTFSVTLPPHIADCSAVIGFHSGPDLDTK